MVVGMWTYQHHHDIAASASAVWPLYCDVANWPRWDEGMERVDLDGAFTVNSAGVMHVKGFGPVPFVLSAVETQRRFDTDSPMDGFTLRFEHLVEPINDGHHCRITHRVIITGPAADQVGPVMGPKVTADIPHSMARIAELAETVVDSAPGEA